MLHDAKFVLFYVQQLPSRQQWCWAASQSEEKQEQLKQWQHQKVGDQESLEPGGSTARDPATAQDPHQTSSHQVGNSKMIKNQIPNVLNGIK